MTSRLMTAAELGADRERHASHAGGHSPNLHNLARAFAMSRPLGDPDFVPRRAQWTADVNHVADAISWSNPHFNRARFKIQCNQP